MKVIGIVGSPRKNGNSMILTQVTLEAIQIQGIETELISLAKARLLPCIDCGTCKKIEDCPLDDNLIPIYESIKASQGIVLASPVYFGSATPSTKALMDRAGYIPRNNGHTLAGKVGGPLAVGNRAGHLFTLAQMLLWFNYCGIIVPGTPYWSTAFGRDPHDIENDEEGLRRARLFGSSMGWLLKRLVPS